MDPALLDRLENYLRYMQQIGYAGLAVERSPFKPVGEPGKVVPMRPAAPPTVPAAKPATAKAKPKTPAAEKPRPLANLVSIMDMMDAAAPAEDTADKAASIGGADGDEALRNLYQAFYQCQACALGSTRRRFVFGEGPPDAELMFVGEGPGAEDDRAGRPFLGDAGELLTRIVKSMGLQRGDVFIANVVKCHPSNGRAPLPDEIASCSPILAKQVEIVKPKVIVALGPTALRFFKGPEASIMRSRGRFFPWRGIPVMPTYHPAYVLRNPRAKRDVWEDIQQVMAKLGMPGAP